MLSVEQLEEFMKVWSYSAKGAGVGVGGVSPPAEGSEEPPPGKLYLWEGPEGGFQAIWSSYMNLWSLYGS